MHFHQIVPGAFLLTSNKRLATTLSHQFDTHCQTQNLTVWERAQIMPLTTWAESLWRSLNTEPVLLLNTLQEQCLWQKIVNQSEVFTLEDPSALQNAWQLLHSYQISLESLRLYETEQSHLFRIWCETMQETLHSNQWLTQAEVLNKINPLITKESYFFDGKQFLLSGYDEITPQLQNTLNHLQAHTHVKILQAHQKAESINFINLKNQEDEIEQMARFAKERWLTNPSHKIGCIIPDLMTQRSQVLDIFKEILGDRAAFEISASPKLRDYQLIALSLNALKLLNDSLYLEDLNPLLQSWYFSQNDVDRSAGALLNVELHRYQQKIFSFKLLYQALEKLVKQHPQTTWLRRLREFDRYRKQKPHLVRPSLWIKYFNDCLTALGWPGTRTLNSLEYQLLERWKKLAQEFSSLDVVLGEISFEKALSLVSVTIRNHSFQPKQTPAPIHILNLADACGYEFDTLWISGMHHNAWPKSAAPNPFIPYPLQIKHGIPHVSAKNQLIFAQKIMNRLLASSPEIVFSAPLESQGESLTPSHLVKHFPHIEIGDLKINQEKKLIQQVLESSQLETIFDDQAPRVADDEMITGGTDIIKNQSLCPFRAFATHRLSAKPLEQVTLGISAAQRGTWLHAVLQQIWQQLKNQRALLEIDNKDLTTMINNLLDQVTGQWVSKKKLSINPAILEIEKICLTERIFKWLDKEKNREPFRIKQLEFSEIVSFDQLKISIKIDRIDELLDGSFILIDYKTGKVSTKEWLNARPKNPQLPFYCTFSSQSLTHPFAGLFAGKIDIKKPHFIGYYSKTKETAELFKTVEVKTDWLDVLETWKKDIQTLAHGFLAGQAQIDPIDKLTCHYCKLKPLCRVES